RRRQDRRRPTGAHRAGGLQGRRGGRRARRARRAGDGRRAAAVHSRWSGPQPLQRLRQEEVVTLPPGERIAAELAAEGRPVPDIVVEPDADRLARVVASALVARLSAAQAVHGTASVVLTGGGIGTAVLGHVAALAAEPEHAVVDWTAVDVW